MKRCIVCLKDIEDSAEECPYCGSYQVNLDSDFDMQYDNSVSNSSGGASSERPVRSRETVAPDRPVRGRETSLSDRPAGGRETATNDRPAVKERTKSESIKAAAPKNGSSSRILVIVAVILVLALAGTFIFLLKTGCDSVLCAFLVSGCILVTRKYGCRKMIRIESENFR